LSSEPIDEISKGFVFSASLIGLFCELTSALWAYRPRPDSAPSDLLGFGVAVIAEVANNLVAAIDNDHIFLRHFLTSSLGRVSFSLRRRKDSRQIPSIVKVEIFRLGKLIPVKNKI
jgi:hypothetical protein